jgi:hypothetical protein
MQYVSKGKLPNLPCGTFEIEIFYQIPKISTAKAA